MRVVHELSHREVVEHRRERVEVALEPFLGRPSVERDPALVGCVAGRHPFGLLDAQAVEEPAEPRGRALADADDPDGRRLEHLDLDALPEERMGEDHRRHPPCGSAPDDHDLADRGREVRRLARRVGRVRVIEDRCRRTLSRYGHWSTAMKML